MKDSDTAAHWSLHLKYFWLRGNFFFYSSYNNRTGPLPSNPILIQINLGNVHMPCLFITKPNIIRESKPRNMILFPSSTTVCISYLSHAVYMPYTSILFDWSSNNATVLIKPLTLFEPSILYTNGLFRNRVIHKISCNLYQPTCSSSCAIRKRNWSRAGQTNL